jgi:sugar lactone lactonase YvrE
MATAPCLAQAQPVLFRDFDPALGELPESISFDADGNLFLSMGNTVRRLTPDGALTVYGTLPINAFALGVKVGPDGCVYNVSTSLDPAVVGAFVWRICEPGEVEQFAALDPTGGPNDLAFDDEGRLLVTDPILGRIWRVDADGQASVWLDDPLLQGDPANPALQFSRQGVNGIAFDERGRHLYVGNLDYGRILSIRIRRDGSAGALRVFAESPLLRGADGIAFDEQRTLYVSVGAQDQLVSVSRQGVVSLVAQGDLLNGPASVAFATACGDETSLYIADLDFLRAFILQDGSADPNLLRLPTNSAGLPLLD